MNAAIRSNAAGLLLPLIPVLCMALYWIVSLGSGDSFGVAATYRHGDHNYFPLIAGLARFNFGEWSVFEHVGEGIHPFPLPSLATHALGLGLFGDWGFVLADLVIVACTYFAARRAFRAAALSTTTAEALALVVACGLLGFPGVARWGWSGSLHLWGYRLPRPFVTDLFMLLCVGSVLRIFVGGRQTAKEWIALGLGFGLLLQSRFYSAATVGLAIGSAAALAFVRGPERRRLVVGAFAFAATTLLVSLPFLYQLGLGNPEVRVRLGAFPVERMQPLLLEGKLQDVLLPAVVAALVAGLVRAAGVLRARERNRSLLALAAVCALAGVALPVSTMLLGESIQPYQFGHELVTFKTLTLVVACAHLLELAALQLRRALPRLAGMGAGGRAALLAVVAALCLVQAAGLHGAAVGRRGHTRRDFYRIPEYKKAFRELTAELETLARSDVRVLAALDIAVLDWWSLFGGGHTFAPNACATNIGDDEIEERLLRLLRIVGATQRDVSNLLSDPATVIFLLGCAKYQASSAHRFAPYDDYPPQLRRVIRESSPLNSWQVLLPRSERVRLLTRYEQTPSSEDPRLDAIVLGRGPLDEGLVPSRDRFQLSFENELFRLYRASNGAGEAASP